MKKYMVLILIYCVLSFIFSCEQRPQESGDRDAPVLNGAGGLQQTGNTLDSLSLSWEAASDNETAPENLKYQVFHGITPFSGGYDDINGTAKGKSIWLMGETSYTINNLEPDCVYFIVIVVEDDAHNREIYGSMEGYTDYWGSFNSPCSSCKAMKDIYPDTTDGVIWIDADNNPKTEPVAVFCEMDFEGGGWAAVFNYMRPGENDPEDALTFYNAITANAAMDYPVKPDSTSTAIYTKDFNLTQYSDVVYGWATSISSNVSRYGIYSLSTANGLKGQPYIDGYPGDYTALPSFRVEPDGTVRSDYRTGSDVAYPHVGIGVIGQRILWGFDHDASAYGHWGNWETTNMVTTTGNTVYITTNPWRYVIYIR